MKTMKRFVAALLAGVLALAMLTACSGGPTGDVQFEGSVEDAYLAALNGLFDTHFSNDAELKAMADKRLDKIVDGKVAIKDYGEAITTEDRSVMKESWVITDREREREEGTEKGFLIALGYAPKATQKITVSQEELDEDYALIPFLIETGKQTTGKDYELSGFGVATRTIQGKVYVAVAFRISQVA